MFVDDMLGVCWAEDLEHDMTTASSLCTRLLGERAITEHKSKSGVRLALLGWTIDLTQMLVTIASKNALRAFFGYAHRDLSGFIPVKVAQAYASWAERYGEVCVWMRPWRRVLYQMIRGREKQRLVQVSSIGQRVVRLYQALLALTLHREGLFTRSFSSFRQNSPTLMVTFDGSLDQKGTYIGLAVSFDSGLRPCSVTLRDGPRAEDHCIRAKHFLFWVELATGRIRLTGGEEIRAFLVVDFHVRMAQVVGVDIMAMTGKTQGRPSFSREAKSIGRRSAFETVLLKDILEWMVISGVLADDEFVTRYFARKGGAPGPINRRVVTAFFCCKKSII